MLRGRFAGLRFCHTLRCTVAGVWRRDIHRVSISADTFLAELILEQTLSYMPFNFRCQTFASIVNCE